MISVDWTSLCYLIKHSSMHVKTSTNATPWHSSLCFIFCSCNTCGRWLTVGYFFYVSLQAKYKERGTVIAEDQIVQVSHNKCNVIIKAFKKNKISRWPTWRTWHSSLSDVQTIGDVQVSPGGVCEQTQRGDQEKLTVQGSVPGNVRHHWSRPSCLWENVCISRVNFKMWTQAPDTSRLISACFFSRQRVLVGDARRWRLLLWAWSSDHRGVFGSQAQERRFVIPMQMKKYRFFFYCVVYVN